MIKLNVCEYCHGCLEFEPQVTQRPELLLANNAPRGFIGDTVVQCENRYKCEVLYNFLKKENTNAEN
jgi:hypothetical protein|nr:MAG TPA: hypothetical protein [Caudoviricetes sp.]